MNLRVTPDIVKDLLPLYVDGDLSADSRAAVEAALAADPEMRRLADALSAEAAAPVPAIAPHASAERDSLTRAKSLLRRRAWLLGGALMFTSAPLTFVFEGTHLRFLLVRDAPTLAAALLVVAAGLWVAFAVTAHRARVTGL